MRILGFSEEWAKLKQHTFTTFRLPRKDRDWVVGETVQVVLRPRSKQHVTLGTAKIIAVEQRRLFSLKWATSDKYNCPFVTDEEAIADGFVGEKDMYGWMNEIHGDDARFIFEPMNKLTLRWILTED